MIKSAFSDTAFRIQMFFFPSLTQNNQIMQPFAHVNMHLGALKCIVYVALKPMSCVFMGGGEGGGASLMNTLISHETAPTDTFSKNICG